MADRRRDRGSSSVSFVAAAVLARQPLSIAYEPGPGAVDQRVGRSRRRAVGYIGHRRSLPPARDGKVRHRAGESCHVQDAGHHARALPRRQTKQNLPHQAKLDCCIGERRRASRAARPLGEHSISLSSRIRSDPRCFGASSRDFHCIGRSRTGPDFVMRTGLIYSSPCVNSRWGKRRNDAGTVTLLNHLSAKTPRS